jgi:peptide chain release factor 2
LQPSRNAWKRSGGIFDIPAKQKRLEELEHIIAEPAFWNDSREAQKVTRERKTIDTVLGAWRLIEQGAEDCHVLLELAGETASADDDIEQELHTTIDDLARRVTELEFKKMLGGEHDFNDAFVSINAGAGGTEAQDWANMLLRMYLRWAEHKQFKTSIIDILEGEEAGIKSATFTVGGDYAYGYLKAEVGIHRLVRISPFDAGARRHTSFASLFVYPDIEEDIEITIDDKDLRVDTYRSSGAGGQHVNKTDSAVRITHVPTGIVVQCQNERSQHMNRATCMKILKAHLYERELQEREKEVEKLQSDKKKIAWGSQIRSYVLQPYRLVKDHRTNVETGNVDAVLDGEIDPFIEAYLMR